MTIKKGLNGITTAYNMTRIKLTPGVIHYSNVIAYNYAGSHTTTSSDGFVVDHKAPMAGVVYDGLGQYLVSIIPFFCLILINGTSYTFS